MDPFRPKVVNPRVVTLGHRYSFVHLPGCYLISDRDEAGTITESFPAAERARALDRYRQLEREASKGSLRSWARHAKTRAAAAFASIGRGPRSGGAPRPRRLGVTRGGSVSGPQAPWVKAAGRRLDALGLSARRLLARPPSWVATRLSFARPSNGRWMASSLAIVAVVVVVGAAALVAASARRTHPPSTPSGAIGSDRLADASSLRLAGSGDPSRDAIVAQVEARTVSRDERGDDHRGGNLQGHNQGSSAGSVGGSDIFTTQGGDAAGTGGGPVNGSGGSTGSGTSGGSTGSGSSGGSTDPSGGPGGAGPGGGSGGSGGTGGSGGGGGGGG